MWYYNVAYVAAYLAAAVAAFLGQAYYHGRVSESKQDMFPFLVFASVWPLLIVAAVAYHLLKPPFDLLIRMWEKVYTMGDQSAVRYTMVTRSASGAERQSGLDYKSVEAAQYFFQAYPHEGDECYIVRLRPGHQPVWLYHAVDGDWVKM